MRDHLRNRNHPPDLPRFGRGAEMFFAKVATEGGQMRYGVQICVS